MKLYEEGYQLKENEYLLKICENGGFLTKFNKDGSIPKAFKDWGNIPERWRVKNKTYVDLQIFIFEENFNEGWRIDSWRFGESQNWAKVLHPSGFLIEIYLQQLLEIIMTNTIIDGLIIGKFKWQNHKLIKN